MKKILCCISASIIAALSVNSSIAATNPNLSSLRVKSGSAKAYISGTSAGVTVGVNKASDVASNIKVTGLPSGIKAVYNSDCDSLTGKQVCRIQFKGDGTAKAGSYLIAITGDGVSTAHLALTVADPHVRISSGLMSNPTKPLAMTVQNMSDETIHLHQLSLSNGSAMEGWKLSHDACSGQTLLPQQSCTYSIASSSNEAGNRATVMVSAPEVSKPILKDIVIPYPKLKVSDAGNRATVTLNDHDTKVITITNSSPYIAVPGIGYQLGGSKFASGQVSISNSCGKLLGPSAKCSFSVKSDKITSKEAGHKIPLTITANGNNVLSTLNVALNDSEQLQFSVAPRQYPAFEDIVVTNTNAKTATIKYLRMPQGTDISFKDHPNATDPDTTPVCKFGLQLAANQQCHIWLHAKTSAFSVNSNNFIFKITYNLSGRKVKEIDGDSRSVLYLGGTDANGKPMLAAYNGFSYESFAALTDNASASVSFPDGDSVLALATDANGTLYYGGSFSDLQNGQTEVTVNNVAAWNGNDFIALINGVGGGVGLNDTVRALSYNSGSDTLYLGGDFNDNSRTPMNYVASYNNGAIQLFDKNNVALSKVQAPVYALANNGVSKVYMVGSFPLNKYYTNSIIQADFDQDNPFDNPIPIADQSCEYNTEAVSLFDSHIYLGGDSAIYDTPEYFDGSYWQLFATPPYPDLPYAPEGPVNAILRMGNQVLVGGDFPTVAFNSYSVPHTASFAIFNPDNSGYIGSWSSNTGASSTSGDPVIYSMLTTPVGNVYIAGHFDSIDNGISAANLAIYDPVRHSFSGVSNSPFANGAAKAMAIGSVINVDNI